MTNLFPLPERGNTVLYKGEVCTIIRVEHSLLENTAEPSISVVLQAADGRTYEERWERMPPQPAENTLQDWKQRLRVKRKKCMAVLEQMQRELAENADCDWGAMGRVKRYRAAGWDLHAELHDGKWFWYMDAPMLESSIVCETIDDAQAAMLALMERFEERSKEA